MLALLQAADEAALVDLSDDEEEGIQHEAENMLPETDAAALPLPAENNLSAPHQHLE